ncbi:MAG: hypothetical protein IPN53_05330 [Comamonadaceae bacterium]|nr:hypothetical protein [Comamonadaceae bacterium]
MTTDTIAIETEATDTITEVPMRILKVANCLSLSGRSTLGYAIGCDESNAIHLSLRSNSAAGMFSKNWVAFLDIAEALVRADRVTSFKLAEVYPSTSRNNPGFMLAVLLEEGLVCPLDRHYMRQDFKPFQQHINALIDAGVDLGDADEALEALQDCESDTAVEVPEVDVVEVPAVKRGRPSKRA